MEVHQHKVEVFSQGGDGRVCVPKEGYVKKHSLG